MEVACAGGGVRRRRAVGVTWQLTGVSRDGVIHLTAAVLAGSGRQSAADSGLTQITALDSRGMIFKSNTLAALHNRYLGSLNDEQRSEMRYLGTHALSDILNHISESCILSATAALVVGWARCGLAKPGPPRVAERATR